MQNPFFFFSFFFTFLSLFVFPPSSVGFTLLPNGSISGGSTGPLPTLANVTYSFAIRAVSLVWGTSVTSNFNITFYACVFSATGGTKSTYNGYVYWAFTASSTLTVQPSSVVGAYVDFLMAGAGGGGGRRHGGLP